MKKIYCLILCVLCLFCIVSCKGGDPVTLSTPNPSINEDSMLQWQSVEGATGYEYKINGGEAVRVGSDTLKIKLLPGESACVRAIGDGESHLDSEWSEQVKVAGLSTLAKPKLKATSVGSQVLVSWDAVENASGYEYKLNNGDIIYISATSFFLNASDTFAVRANGDGVNYLDSAWATLEPQN